MHQEAVAVELVAVQVQQTGGAGAASGPAAGGAGAASGPATSGPANGGAGAASGRS